MRLKRLTTVLAFLSSLASFIAIAGGGLTLFAISVSGERGTGALLALCGFIAFAAVMALVFAREGTFGSGIWRGVAILAAIAGAVPPAAIAFAAIRFAGLPFGSRMPFVDWVVLFVGILFALGVVAILALGHRRSLESGEDLEASEEEAPVVHMQQIRNAQQQLRSAFEAPAPSRPNGAVFEDDDIRVRRV
jgi:hypothetical protein